MLALCRTASCRSVPQCAVANSKDTLRKPCLSHNTFNVYYQCGDWRGINYMVCVISMSLHLCKSYTALQFLYWLLYKHCSPLPLASSRVDTTLDYCHLLSLLCLLTPVAYRGGRGFGVLKPPPPKFRRPSKIVPNSTRLWKLLKIVDFRTPTPKDVRKKGSKILKLPRFAIVLH